MLTLVALGEREDSHFALSLCETLCHIWTQKGALITCLRDVGLELLELQTVSQTTFYFFIYYPVSVILL